ncbi:MAG: hypothetical protein WC861_02780 [Candidatus Micrarchaeia archaeon]|jgi:hypothetical protein
MMPPVSNVMGKALKNPELKAALTSRLIGESGQRRVQSLEAAFARLEGAYRHKAVEMRDPSKEGRVTDQLVAAIKEICAEMRPLDAEMNAARTPDDGILKAAQVVDLSQVADVARLLASETCGKDIGQFLQFQGSQMVIVGMKFQESNKRTKAPDIRMIVGEFAESLIARGRLLRGLGF